MGRGTTIVVLLINTRQPLGIFEWSLLLAIVLHCISYVPFGVVFGACMLVASAAMLVSLVQQSGPKRSEVLRIADTRFEIVGKHSDLSRIGQYTEELNEPHVQHAGSVTVLRHWHCLLVVYVLAFGLGLTLEFVLGWSQSMAMAAVVAVIVTVRICTHLGFPLYYRVTPGRIEALTSKLLSHRTRLCGQIELKGAYIHCRLFGAMGIKQGDDEMIINLVDLQDQFEFIRAVMNAAACHATPPRLIPDMLTG